VTRIIFDAGANAHFFHHFQIKFRALLDALGFEQFPVALKFHDAACRVLRESSESRVSFFR